MTTRKKRGEKSIEVVYKFYRDVSREFGQYISSYIIPGFSSLKVLRNCFVTRLNFTMGRTIVSGFIPAKSTRDVSAPYFWYNVDVRAETLSPYGYGLDFCYVFSADFFRPELMDRMHPKVVSGCQPDTSKVHIWFKKFAVANLIW